MSHEWNVPESTEHKLYASNADTGSSFGNLFDVILEHFGPETKLNDVNIRVEQFTNVAIACGCCKEDEVKSNYFVITRRTTPCEFTPATLLSELTTDE